MLLLNTALLDYFIFSNLTIYETKYLNFGKLDVDRSKNFYHSQLPLHKIPLLFDEHETSLCIILQSRADASG